MLPPGLESRSPHKYGSFNVKVSMSNVQIGKAEYVELMMLGMKKSQQSIINKNGQAQFKFDISTNLWSFYAYLHDAREMQIAIRDANGRRYQSQIILHLMPSKQILNKNNTDIDFLFQSNSFLLINKAKGDVTDSKFNHFGFIHLALNLNFHEQINRVLFSASLIDFQDILVIDQISPISSTLQLPQQDFKPLLVEPIKQQPLRQIPKKQYVEQVKPPKVSEQQSIIEDQKMMQDEIDRLIAQMQNKPYDSSKYMEQLQEPKNQNINFINTLPNIPRPHNQSREKSIQKPSSLSKYKPVTISKNNSFNISQPQLACTVSEGLCHSQPISIRSQTDTTSYQKPDGGEKTGLIKLKVHQFTMSKMEKELSLLLKIYLNADSDQFYSINGLKQGQTISFNTNLKINQKRQIRSIRFVLIDAFDMKTLFAQGTFQMSRLFSLNPTKGIFMVNLLSNPPQTNVSKVVRLQEQSLVRVTPNTKNLRIELQYEEEIEIVQIYLRLSDFSPTVKKICYKVPLTKQTIEYRISATNNSKHINIFPHNRAKKGNDKIIIEAWGQNQLLGFNQASLKPVANTNQLIMNSSIQPILLYDQSKEVKDIKNNKMRGSFWLQLYYGTIAQIQNILNKEEQPLRKRHQPSKPIQVQQQLGIYIKQKKQKRQVEVQVDHQEIICKGSQKNLLQLQQEELPDEDEDQDWQHQQNEQNQFISRSMEQKYVLDTQKQTVPILKNNPSSQNTNKSMELSQTTKLGSLKSITKQFQQWTKDILSDLATQEAINSLKQQIKPYLLYNFIEQPQFTNILKNRGVSHSKIKLLLKDILPCTNQMVNVNILYDMVLGLILEGEVKQKLIDDYQIGRYCLMVLYNSLEDSQQDFLFDQGTEFDQSRKIYEQIGFRITMREFNLIHMFIKRTKQNKSITDKQIKRSLVEKYVQQIKQVQTKKAKQKQIISQIYQHHEWDQDQDFILSNINQHHSQQSIASNTYTQHQIFSSTSKQTQNKTDLFLPPERSRETRQQTISAIKHSFPPKAPIVKEQQVIKANYKLLIQGFQTCIETTQCLLDLPLTAPKLKITCNSNKQEQFWVTRSRSQLNYQIQVYIADSEFLEGSIELTDNLKSIAKCNVSIMANMKSCYSLKNNQTLQFCGILKLLLSGL